MAEDAKDETEGTEEGKKGGMLKWIIIGVAGVAIVAASVFGTLMFVNGGNESEESVAAVPEDPKAIYFAVNPKFQTNYQVNGRQRLFQVALTLVTRDHSVIAALSKHAPSIRNKVVILLGGQSFENLQTLDGREGLREELLVGIQEILSSEIGKPGIERVLFTDFVMQ